MEESRRFPVEKIAKLDNPQRRERLPPGPLVDLIAGYQPGTVADIGVGIGYFAIPLAQRLPDVRILGLDVEPRMLEALAERAGECANRIEPVLTPGARPALRQAGVDLALLAAVYHELDDRPSYLKEVWNALVPGGHVVICDWRHDRGFEHGPPEHHRLSEAEVRRDLRAAGFSSIEAHELYQACYVLSARREPGDDAEAEGW